MLTELMIDAFLQLLFRSRVFKIKQQEQPIIRTRNTFSKQSREAKKGQQ